MSGHEKIGGEDTGGKPDVPSVVASPSVERHPEKKFPAKPDFQIGQVWIRPENGFQLQIVKQPSKNRFDILLQEEGQLGETKWNASKTELEKMISNGYILSVSDPLPVDKEEIRVNDSLVVEETSALAKPTEESIDGGVSESKRELLDEFDVLGEAIAKILNGTAELVSLHIEEILKENRIALGDEYVTLSEAQEKIVTAINKASHEDDVLFDEIEKSKKIISAQLKKKRELKTRLEGLSEELLALERVVKESIEAAKNGTTEPAPEQKHLNAVEKKIGEEKYKALSQFVERVSKSLDPERKKNKTASVTSRAVQSEVWEESLSALQIKIEAFLQEQTDLLPDDREFVWQYLIQEAETKRGASRKQADSNIHKPHTSSIKLPQEEASEKK